MRSSIRIDFLNASYKFKQQMGHMQFIAKLASREAKKVGNCLYQDKEGATYSTHFYDENNKCTYCDQKL